MSNICDKCQARRVSGGLRQAHFATSILAALYLLTNPVLADTNDITTFADLDDDMMETPGFDTEPEPEDESDWRFTLGLIGGFKPEYEGSDDYEASYSPNHKISWRDTVILQGKNLRVQYKSKNYRVGALVGKESGRKEDDNDNLDGLGDVDGGWAAGLYGDYNLIKRVKLKAEGRQEFSGGHGGLVVETGVEIELPVKEPIVRSYVGVTYASSDYMEEFFSISSKQSARSGKSTYNADAGIKNVTLALSAGYDITDNWVIGAIIRYDRLVGDAADSPIVKSGGSPNQFTGGASIAYQF